MPVLYTIITRNSPLVCVQFYTAHILACGWFAVSATTAYPASYDVGDEMGDLMCDVGDVM